jgi:hypothetical protein
MQSRLGERALGTEVCDAGHCTSLTVACGNHVPLREGLARTIAG